MTEPTGKEILDAQLPDNDAEAATIRDYLVKLLLKVWIKEQGFNGKRPFGNSSWQSELYQPLIENGWVEGSFDDDGYIRHVDHVAAHALIVKAIQTMGELSR